MNNLNPTLILSTPADATARSRFVHKMRRSYKLRFYPHSVFVFIEMWGFYGILLSELGNYLSIAFGHAEVHLATAF